MKWTLGLIGALLVVVAVNGFFLFKALQNPAQIEQSYLEEAR